MPCSDGTSHLTGAIPARNRLARSTGRLKSHRFIVAFRLAPGGILVAKIKSMDAKKYVAFPLLLLGTLLLGLFIARSLPQTIPTPMPPPEITTQAATMAPRAPKLPMPPAAAASDTSGRDARIAEIEHEVEQMTIGNAQAIRSLDDELARERARNSGLRSRLAQNYGVLMAEAVRASLGSGSRRNLDFELAVNELQQQLTTAKLAVAEQRRQHSEFIGSDSTEITRGYLAELTRRQRVAQELELDLQVLFHRQQNYLDSVDAQKATRLRSWRQERTELENAFAESERAIELALLRRQQLVREEHEKKKRLEQLEAEWQRLLPE